MAPKWSRPYLGEAFERIGLDPARYGGKAWPHVTALPVKFLSIGKYMIISDDRFTPVRIVAIAGGSQDLSRLLDIDPRFDDFDKD